MAKPRKYKPLKKILSVDHSLMQASTLLDIAAQKAVDDGDIQGMKKVARAWLELGAVMNQFSSSEEAEEVEEHEVVSRTEIGFRGIIEEAEEDEDFEEEDKLQIGFRANG